MKYFKQILFTIVISTMWVMGVNAASGSITVSTSIKTAVVGSTFNVTVKVSCSEEIGSWQYGIEYSSSNISLVSGDTTVAGYGDGKIKSKTYTYKFKATKSGSANIKIIGASMVSWNDDSNLFTPSTNSVGVSIKTQSEIEASYSKDNYLKSITVDGYTLNPEFDKEKTNYVVSVPDTVTEIKVSASPNDSRSRVSGTGTIDISEGTNKVEIVVTAQNGSTRTYTLTVDVRDLNPIEVEVNGTKYTIVKKSDLLIAPTGFTLSTIKIGDVEVPAYKSELASLVVVGLKDESANIKMFIYDEDSKSYTPYSEVKGHSVVVYPKKPEDIPNGYDIVKMKIGELEYEILRNKSVDNFYLIYGINVETGKTEYYIYDDENSGLIRYNKDVFDNLTGRNEEYSLYLILISALAGSLFLITIILGMKNSKLKKIIKLKLKEVQSNKENNNSEDKRSTKKSKKHKEDKSDFLDDDSL